MLNLSFKVTLAISQHDAKSSVLSQLVMKTIKCTICRLMRDFLNSPSYVPISNRVPLFSNSRKSSTERKL